MIVPTGAQEWLANPNAAVPVPAWVPIFLLVGAAWGITAGLLFRAGRLRRLGRWYFDADAPVFLRNLGPVQLPTGVGFLSAAAMLLFYFLRTPWGDAIAMVALIIFLLSLLALARTFYRPPDWMKPKWLLDAEHGRMASAGAPAGRR